MNHTLCVLTLDVSIAIKNIRVIARPPCGCYLSLHPAVVCCIPIVGVSSVCFLSILLRVRYLQCFFSISSIYISLCIGGSWKTSFQVKLPPPIHLMLLFFLFFHVKYYILYCYCGLEKINFNSICC
jgi:hypothetical protein